MSTDFFRRYLDLLNEATGQPPVDFTPTHFHKNNLGARIPLMQTPDGSFWWETTATSDDGGPVQRGGARKSIQPWIGDTENRSSGFSGKSSVDGVFKNGEAIEFPEGMTWKEYAAKSRSPQAALPAAKSKQIEPELLAPLEPTDSGRKPVAPNTSVALPSSGTFSNDQALANLAAQMKDAKSGLAVSTGNKIDSPESLEILRKIKALGEEANKLSDTIDPTAPDAKDEIQKNAAIMQQFVSLFQQMAKLPENSVSEVTFQQVKDIYNSSINKIQSRIRSFETRAQQLEKELEKDVAASSKDSSGAAAGSGSGARWAFVPGDGTSKDISGKKDGSGLPSAAEIGTGTAGAAASKKTEKETMITDSSRCAQCGTPKSIHTPLKHQFVPGDDVRPGSVGGSQSSSTDTLAADQARINKMVPYDRSTRTPVGAKPALPPKPMPPKPRSPGSSLKEDINQLPVADQMRSWRQLMEAPSGLTAAQSQAQRAGLGRPGVVGVKDKPDTRNLSAKLRDQDRQRFSTGADIDRQVPKPKVPASTAGFLQPVSPNSPLGRAQATAPAVTPPAAPADWKAKVKLGMKTLATPAAALYSIYQGWQQISALPKDKMSREQYAAEVTKIVAKLVQENGIVLVSTYLGGLAGAPIGGVGAIPGMVAGAAGGLAAEYYFGDNISKVVNGVVDYMYGTDKTPAPQQNKPTPAEVAENKTYLEGMAVWIAADGIPTEQDKKEMDAARALLKSAGVTVAPAPAPQAAEKVTTADSVAQYKETFDKANAIVDKIKNLDPMTNPALSSSASGAALAKALYNLISELTSLYASEIGAEGQKDPAVKAQMDAILAAARAAAEAKNAEHDAGREKTTTSGPKEGDTGTSKNGRPIIFTNGRWEYAN